MPSATADRGEAPPNGQGRHHQVPVALIRRSLGRVSSDALSGAHHAVRVVASGLRYELSLVRANHAIANGELGGKRAGETTLERVSNIVFMGMGEPLANYNRVMRAIRCMVEPQPNGLGMSARNITVSTVGLAPGIARLADENLPITFALSLHAPDDGLRDELIPVNSRWKVDEVLDAARAYFDKTGRRVSIEYALIKDMNDHAWRADLLGEKLNERGRGWVHVNPIPLNPTPGSVWTASTRATTNEFVRRLEAAGIPTTVRDTRGSDIDGACGQLAAAD